MQVNIQEGIIAEVHRFMTLAAHQYQEIVLEHFFNGQSYEVKQDRIDAARRFLLQCLIAKDFLEEVFL